LKCVDIVVTLSKNALPCYENEFIGNIWIYNPMQHYLYPLKEVFIMRTTKKTILISNGKFPTKKVMAWATPSYITTTNHFVPCNMWNSMEYAKACSLTLNYYTLFVWTSMVLLVHKKFKSTNEFIRFCIELGEF